MILAVCILFRLASSLRLITLPPLDKKGNGIFIKNDSQKLKLERVSLTNISDMYVVVHSRKIYFYNRGSYYGFGYDSDNITLKLMPVPVGKVHYFTQEITDRPRPRRARWSRVVRGDRDDSGIKTVRATKMVSEKETLEEDSTTRAQMYIRTKASGGRCGVEDRSDEKACDAEDTKPKENYGTLLKSLGEILQSYKRPVQRSAEVQEKDIESDSETLGGHSLDIVIEMVDQKEKAFTLKNERNMCVTYFQKSFIMAACTKSKRQMFKLVDAEDVADRFKKPTKSATGFDDIESEESSSSEEKPVKKLHELGIKKHRRLSGAKAREKKKKGRKPVEDSDKSYAPSSTSVQTSSADSGETRPAEKRLEPDFSASNPVLPKAVPMPRRIDEYCRDMYNRSGGQIDRLPKECLAFFGFKQTSPPMFRRAVKFPIPAPQRLSTAMKVSKDITPKVVENNPKEPSSAMTAEQQNINVIERLERALGTDMFLK